MASFLACSTRLRPVPAVGLDVTASTPPSFQHPVPVPRPGLGAHAQLGERPLEPAGPLLDGLSVAAQAGYAEPVRAARPQRQEEDRLGRKVISRRRPPVPVIGAED